MKREDGGNPYLLYAVLLPLTLLAYGRGNGACQWAIYQGAAYLLIPLFLSLLLGFKPGDVGLRVGGGEGYRWALLLVILSIPISVYGITVPSMRDYYPVFSYSGWFDFALKECLMGIVMFSNEAFFRGFLLLPLAERAGSKWIAVFLQDVPYTLVHIGKPGVEVPYAFIAGIVFALIDLRSRSVLPSFVVHWSGSTFFDVLCALYKMGLLVVPSV
ncbi:MAG: CPBP family intramembrane metalloprotease [Thermococci archaeon]|nr:CPBP family intramembrane metalloprotease [Thermococci archaeon]